MNSSERPHPRGRADQIADDATLSELLGDVRLRFYGGQPAVAFHRDRRRLLYALTWPAVWLEDRGLFCSGHRYRRLVVERLDVIRAHGDPYRYAHYFPTYLLKCLQDFLDRHGDDLYVEFKHIRNALDQVCGVLRFAEKAQVQSRQIEAMAQVHRMLHSRPPPPSDPAQMALF